MTPTSSSDGPLGPLAEEKFVGQTGPSDDYEECPATERCPETPAPKAVRFYEAKDMSSSIVGDIFFGLNFKSFDPDPESVEIIPDSCDGIQRTALWQVADDIEIRYTEGDDFVEMKAGFSCGSSELTSKELVALIAALNEALDCMDGSAP